MGYVALPRFLFRAPLLPARALADARRGLQAHPLGATAVALASPALAAAMARAPRAPSTGPALERYARRAAFRPTPHGLWAGVGVGDLAAQTRLRTGGPAARLAPSWARLAALGRALLERAEVREEARLRRAPSLTLGARTMTWLGPPAADDFCEERTSELDEALEAVARSCGAWTPWAAVREAAAAGLGADIGQEDDGDGDHAGTQGDAPGDVDEWLLTLIDDGVLVVDTVPPLIGPPAPLWMTERLARLPAADDVARQLEAARTALAAGDLTAAEATLARLPGASRASAAVQGTLVFAGASTHVALSRAAVARAAALAPLLFRLQEALAPPSAERTPGRALAETLDAATEIFGAGALELSALTRGEYGAAPAGDPGEPDAPAPDMAGAAAVMAFLAERIVTAARDGAAELTLRADELEPLLPGASPPATCELFLTPCGPRPGTAPGDRWLLGLHAPAGASWGRFAGVLAADEAGALFDALAEAERRARPDEKHLDVAFAPAPRVAELCAHPPLRDAALALTDWPAGERPAVTLDDLLLVADPAALEPLALRSAAGDVVTPSPLHRVRSTTAPRGVWRLLAGWNLRRQHAPWALTWGPLGALAWTPRVRLDGFVIAPASWRLPAGPMTARRLGAWRRAHRVPRHVQVGHEDELMPVDLQAPGARALLAGHERVHEIWPPLGDTPDRDGRRVEAVVALVDEPDARAAAAATATRAAGPVPPPARLPAGADAPPWVTFKLFGAAERQDAVLAEVVAPLLAKAGRARWVRRWFFQRYVEGPGRRPHLRLRVAGHTDAVAHALDAQLTEARRTGDIVTVERAPYFPEAARFGGEAALPAVHALFQATSELALAALADAGPDDEHDGQALGDEDPRLLLLIAAHDALARAAGLDTARRRALARQRRDAHAADVDEDFAAALATDFRRARAALRAVLGDRDGGPLGRWLAPYQRAAQAALAALSPERRLSLLPALLHLDAVRLMGPDRDAEIRAYTFWERTLDSLEKHAPAPPGRGR